MKRKKKSQSIYKHKIDSSFYARRNTWQSWVCGNVLECIGASILFLSSTASWSLKSASNCLRSRAHFGGGGGGYSWHGKAVNERNSIHTLNTTRRARTYTFNAHECTMTKRESKQQYKIYAHTVASSRDVRGEYIWYIWCGRSMCIQCFQWNWKWFVSGDDKIGNRKTRMRFISHCMMAPVRSIPPCRSGHCAIIIFEAMVLLRIYGTWTEIIAINRKSHHKFLSADIILWLCIRGMQWKSLGEEG